MNNPGPVIPNQREAEAKHAFDFHPKCLEAIMPEVVSCPKCQRKSRVPDTLVGKKVKCPGCAEIFTANVNGPAAPKKEEPAKKKSDDDEQEGETYEVVNDRKKRRSDDDDDEERVSDKPRPRRRTEDDDEDDDKPRKSRTSRDDDDDDDDDERVSTAPALQPGRRDDDDDDDDDDRGGAVSRKRVPKADWTRVRMGLSLLLASVLTSIGVIIFLTVGLCCVGAGAAGMAGNAGAAGKPPGRRHGGPWRRDDHRFRGLHYWHIGGLGTEGWRQRDVLTVAAHVRLQDARPGSVDPDRRGNHRRPPAIRHQHSL